MCSSPTKSEAIERAEVLQAQPKTVYVLGFVMDLGLAYELVSALETKVAAEMKSAVQTAFQISSIAEEIHSANVAVDIEPAKNKNPAFKSASRQSGEKRGRILLRGLRTARGGVTRHLDINIEQIYTHIEPQVARERWMKLYWYWG